MSLKIIFCSSRWMRDLDLKHINKSLESSCLVDIDPARFITVFVGRFIKHLDRFCLIAYRSATAKLACPYAIKWSTIVAIMAAILNYLNLVGAIAEVPQSDIAVCPLK